MPRSHKSEIPTERERVRREGEMTGVIPNMADASPSALCLLSLPLKTRKQSNQRMYYKRKANDKLMLACKCSGKWSGGTVSWLEVSVNDFNWSFCVEVMHPWKEERRKRFILWLFFMKLLTSVSPLSGLKHFFSAWCLHRNTLDVLGLKSLL